MSKKLVGDRMVVKKAELEKKLLGYLRKAGRFIDAAEVAITPVTPAADGHANWSIAAVNYGKAPKADCDEELTRIAPLFLRHFNIAAETADEPAAEADAAAEAVPEPAPAA